MPIIEIGKYKCPRCGKIYEDSARSNFPGKPCRNCHELIIKISALERQLIADDFSLESKDEQLARQINGILIRESSGVPERDEQILTALTEQMLKDEKRRKKILKHILRLQKEKR